MEWKHDGVLEEYLRKKVQKKFKRTEILNFVEKDFSQYKWSLRTLERRLQYFQIKYIDYNVPLEDVKAALDKEMEGPGRLLGYRAMTLKIRQHHQLNVPRDLVYNLMADGYSDVLRERTPVFKKKNRTGNFISKGVNWFHSLDGHDKLMGYQNSTFPIAIYGCMDTTSRKLLWLKCWVSNSDSRLIGHWYIEYLLNHDYIASNMRLDKGTETGVMATIHCYLRSINGDLDDPTKSIHYGPSTSNQIERWWRELHERLEKFFKRGLRWLVEHTHYDPKSQNDRDMLAFVMVPLIQREIDIFRKTVWNTHRIRYQKKRDLPCGVPAHIYSFPEQYGLAQCGKRIAKEQLKEAAMLSGVLDVGRDFLSEEKRNLLTVVIPEPEKIPAESFKDAYLLLKRTLNP